MIGKNLANKMTLGISLFKTLSVGASGSSCV